PDVVLEVERRVVDPKRPSGLQRRDGELLAVARDEVQPPADVVAEVVVCRRRPLEQRDGADVHVRVRPLLRKERRVRRGETVAVLLTHVRSLPSGAAETTGGL